MQSPPETVPTPVQTPVLLGMESSGSLARPYADHALDGNPTGTSLGGYLHALRRRWLVSFVCGLPLAAAIAAAYWFLLPQTHTATAVLRLSADDMPLVFQTADQSAASTFDLFKRTQRQMLMSRFVLVGALRDERVADSPILEAQTDPVAWLASNLNVSFPDDAEIMHVSLSGTDPRGLDKLVNSVVQAYFTEVVNAEKNRKLARLSSMETAYSNAEIDIRRKRTELRQLADTVGTGDSDALSIVQQNALQQFAAVRGQLTQLQFELMQAQRELEVREVTAAKDVAVNESELEAAMYADPLLAELQQEQKRLHAYVKSTDALHPQLAAARTEKPKQRIREIDEELLARQAEIRDALVQHTRLTLSDGSEELKHKIAVLEAQEKQLRGDVTRFENEARQFGRSSIDVEMMRAEITALEGVLGRLGEKIEQTKVELQPESKSSWSRISLLGEAEAPRSGDRQSRLTRAIASGVFGFFIPFGLFVWTDARKRRINTVSDVTQGSSLGVVGCVPLIPGRLMRRLNGPSRRHKYWRALLAECVDSVAAVLLREAQCHDKRVILVSSAMAGEGKTTLAGQLAISLASAGKRTVLVDFDLRRPALHRVFDIELLPGVSEILRGQHGLAEAIRPTQITDLWLLPAGRWGQSGLQGLASVGTEALLDVLRAEYDFVIVDGSPILPVVDTRMVGQHVDGVLLSVLRDVSRAPKLEAARQLLESFEIPVMGVVVAGSSEEVYQDHRYEPHIEQLA